ncbi:glycoside hydrolase family 15 protein [Methylotuvimicrobium alcaliphilum]|uniref:Phosphorylase kinase alphabeta n=1 Tax=Methylotuvimicrobium alcaliphilum (strain DSM 19304 / NCIMB 14124 / VKM B-2133 / 20Z) TaxID=1091494 RepID=G4T1H3_META2|nr:glycoside hydrolase family 15 protein [Methylotuvimicrobium alcaliphilum]CCE22395.1 Phosphorylase kinase alphabeta [Methylotuvimicrobium alcaliphilum 20Z]
MKNKLQIEKLDAYFDEVRDIILNRQDWISGLLPASTANNVHGNYNDAWVRDNVYSILAPWGLALAYRKSGEPNGKAYLLEQSVVKLMRGLLVAMMRQAHKVEMFKQTQDPLDALHAKYDLKTGEVVVGDSEWGHLQLDATSLFLLMLAQMTASGLRIVFTIDEVNFVQNLVHYISRAYRTPDYGIWERGNKINRGIAELNASSIGMAKAALEAMSGFNLFGPMGGQNSVIHVISDDIARTRNALESLLPRESLSKEVDAAVLSITGFPAFAVDNQELKNRTEALIREKLEGRYGCKRFLLDGHQTELEDPSRLHYEPHELKQFMDIECEWPLFFCYLLLNNLYAGNNNEAAQYRAKLDALLVEQNGRQLLPELYIVPKEAIDAEKANPNSQDRIPNENIPLVWAQGLFILGNLIEDGLLAIDDIDPLGRHNIREKTCDCTLQVAVIAEDETIQADLKAWGIDTQTLAEISPIQIRDASELAAAYTNIGRNDNHGLTGRPLRQLRTLATSRIYLMANERLVFLPQLLNQKGFYLAMDNRLLIQRLRSELSYIHKNWDGTTGDPLFVLVVKYNMLSDDDRDVLIEFIQELQSGQINSTPIKFGELSKLAESSSYEKIDYLHDFKFSEASWDKPQRPCFLILPIDTEPPEPLNIFVTITWEISDDEALIEQLTASANLYAQLEALALLAGRHGLDYDTGLKDADGNPCRIRGLLEEVYIRAGDLAVWDIIRRSAGLLGKYDIDLEQAATEILVHQHQLTVGRAYSGKATLKRPADSSEILEIIRTYNDTHDASEHIIIQELILYLGMLIKYQPELFADMHTIRVGHILQLILVRQKKDSNCTLDQAYNEVLTLPPYQLMQKVRETLEDFTNTQYQFERVETLNYVGQCQELTCARFSPKMDPENFGEAEDWYNWRERRGSLGRESESFFTGVWDILHHCQGLMIGDKLSSKRRLDSETTLAQMTSGEQSFKLHVNHLLNKIQAPVYRQLTVEALNAMAFVFRDNPSIRIEDTLVTDIIIGHAVRLCWLKLHPEAKDNYKEVVSLAWQAFYQLPPHQVANGMLDALIYLLENNNQTKQGDSQ